MNLNGIFDSLPLEELQVFGIDLFPSLNFEDFEYESLYRGLLAIEAEQNSEMLYAESQTEETATQEYTPLRTAILSNIDEPGFKQTESKGYPMIEPTKPAYENTVHHISQTISNHIENYSAVSNQYQNGLFAESNEDICGEMYAAVRTESNFIYQNATKQYMNNFYFPFEEPQIINQSEINVITNANESQRPTVAYCTFLVQPQSKLSFRFKSEVQRMSCGFLMGETTSNSHLKRNPIIQLKTSANFDGKTIYLHVDLFQKESEHSPHFLHSTNSNNGLILFKMNKFQCDPTGCTINFDIEKLFAVRSKQKNFQTAIATKIFQYQKWATPTAAQTLDDIRRCVYWHNDESNCVMLGCRVFLEEDGRMTPITERIYSKNIYLKSK